MANLRWGPCTTGVSYTSLKKKRGEHSKWNLCSPCSAIKSGVRRGLVGRGGDYRTPVERVFGGGRVECTAPSAFGKLVIVAGAAQAMASGTVNCVRGFVSTARMVRRKVLTTTPPSREVGRAPRLGRTHDATPWRQHAIIRRQSRGSVDLTTRDGYEPSDAAIVLLSCGRAPGTFLVARLGKQSLCCQEPKRASSEWACRRFLPLSPSQNLLWFLASCDARRFSGSWSLTSVPAWWVSSETWSLALQFLGFITDPFCGT